MTAMTKHLSMRLLLPQLILMAPLIRFLTFHRYDIAHREAIIEILLVASVGAVGSFLLWCGGQKIRAATIAALVLIFFDLSFTLAQALPQLMQGVVPAKTGWAVLVVLMVCYAVAYGLVLALQEHAESVLGVVFAVVLASAVLFPGEGVLDKTIHGRQQEARKDLPLFVHLVLDEHGAISGLPDEVEGAGEARKETTDFYTGNGFRLWSRAFSRSSATELSMTSTFNWIQDFQDGLPFREGGGPFAYTMTANKYFDAIAHRGWRIRAFQGHHMDYCTDRGSVVEVCRTYAAISPRLLMDADLPTAQKFVILHSLFWRGSFVYYAARRAYGKAASIVGGLPKWPDRDNVAPVTSVAMLEEVLAAAKEGGRGTMIFAHLFVPHHPYAFKADCSLHSYNEDWLLLGDPSLRYPRLNTPEGWKLRYRRYIEQLRCTNLSLKKFFDGLRTVGLWDDAIIVVQGDHGSRITLIEPDAQNLSLLSARDLRDNFLAHLAVKKPGMKAELDNSIVAIQDAIPHLALGTPMPPAGDYVFLVPRPQDGKYLRVPLTSLALSPN